MKRIYVRIIILVHFMMSAVLAVAQNDPPNIIPLSPTAEAFNKYGDIPVSTYTGVPDITVPIYTISVRDINIPITLRYHASV